MPMRANDLNATFVCRFKIMLIDRIEERMKEWPHYEDYEIATCLDPRFKILSWTDVERHESAWSKLAAKLTDEENETHQRE